MTDTHIKINAVPPKVQYTGNGSTTVFPYEFPIFDDSDMVVYFDDEVQESGYTVSGAGQTEGGNVTFATPPDDGVKITLYRNIPIERVTDFQEGGTFRPKNLNDEFDRQTAFLQQVQETLSRAIKTDVTSDIQPEVILTEVERLYDSVDNVDAVAADLTNIDAVAGDLTNIDAAVANKTNIDAVAANETNINAVNANKTNINAVAGNETNIDAVAANEANINEVASNETNINLVAANEANINAVTANETNINSCASNISAITDAPTQASNAANSATSASDSATAAALSATQSALSAASAMPPPLFHATWEDHILNDQSRLRADTFTWHDGTVYSNAYNHLVNDIGASVFDVQYFAWDDGNGTIVYTIIDEPSAGDDYYSTFGTSAGTIDSVGTGTITIGGTTYTRDSTQDDTNTEVSYTVSPTTETIGSYTITVYVADDGHKIVLPDQAGTVQDIFEQTGASCYYILDVINEQFKLPRSSHGEVVEKYINGQNGYRVYADGWCEQWGSASGNGAKVTLYKTYSNNAYSINLGGGNSEGWGNAAHSFTFYTITTNSFYIRMEENSSLAAGMNCRWDTAGYLDTVPTNTIKRYEYFYVGQFTQTATEQTAGLNAETLNGKMDNDKIQEVSVLPANPQEGILYLIPE